jgi:CheY-like chemotaxis protein
MSIPSKHPILVVDDEPSIRDSLALLLLSAGYDVSTANDGFAALMQLKRALPDLIVSDLNMPQMSGHELLSVVRRRFPQIMTVAMSGDYQSDAVPAGVIADAFFPKGQSPRNLLATIAAMIHTTEARVSAHQREGAPAWIPRNGNDAQGVPYVVVTCSECLLAFQLPVVKETAAEVLETTCRFCASKNRYIIGPSKQRIPQMYAW